MTEREPFLSDKGTLLNGERARIGLTKLTTSTLNPDHRNGGDKALVFQRVRGFTTRNADALIDRIKGGILTASASQGGVTRYGTLFTVDLEIDGPTGRSATVRTGWIDDPGTTTPRLTTAFVRRRRTNGQTGTV